MCFQQHAPKEVEEGRFFGAHFGTPALETKKFSKTGRFSKHEKMDLIKRFSPCFFRVFCPEGGSSKTSGRAEGDFWF